MITPEVAEYTRRTRIAQGLPPTVTDAKVLDLLAALFGKPVTEKRVAVPSRERGSSRDPARATHSAKRAQRPRDTLGVAIDDDLTRRLAEAREAVEAADAARAAALRARDELMAEAVAEGMMQKDVAEALGVSKDVVSSRLKAQSGEERPVKRRVPRRKVGWR